MGGEGLVWSPGPHVGGEGLVWSPDPHVGGEGLVYTVCACVKVYCYVIHELCRPRNQVYARRQLIAKFMVSDVIVKLQNHVVGKFTVTMMAVGPLVYGL